MNYQYHVQLLIVLRLVSDIHTWRYFTTLNDLTLTNSLPEPAVIHSDYTYGDCKRTDIMFYVHIHKNHLEILGKIIVRGWITVPRIPTCIRMRAMSHEEDTFRATAYAMQICIPRITYCHSKKRSKYYYYEWYLPYDMVGGMNWDIYFYGPKDLSWQEPHFIFNQK